MHGNTVGIIEADAQFRRALERVLQARGYVAVGYASGRDFLCSSDHPPLDCLLLDADMAVGDSPELYANLYGVSAHIPLIFMTAYPAQCVAARARALGAVDVLEKPFGATVLLEVMERVRVPVLA